MSDSITPPTDSDRVKSDRRNKSKPFSFGLKHWEIQRLKRLGAGNVARGFHRLVRTSDILLLQKRGTELIDVRDELEETVKRLLKLLKGMNIEDFTHENRLVLENIAENHGTTLLKKPIVDKSVLTTEDSPYIGQGTLQRSRRRQGSAIYDAHGQAINPDGSPAIENLGEWVDPD